MSREYCCPCDAYNPICESVNESFSFIYRVEDAPSSLASTSLAHTKLDVAVGLEQRVLQLPNDSISREAKIAMRKKVDMKKETVTPHRKINAQMVFDPPGEINDTTYYLVQYSTTVYIRAYG